MRRHELRGDHRERLQGHLAQPLAVVLRRVRPNEERLIASVCSGLALFRAGLGKSLLLWLIVLGIGIGAAIAVLTAALIVGLVLALPAIGLAVGGLKTAAIVAGAIVALVWIAPLLVALGAPGTFQHAYWTLAYLRLRALDTEAPAGV